MIVTMLLLAWLYVAQHVDAFHHQRLLHHRRYVDATTAISQTSHRVVQGTRRPQPSGQMGDFDPNNIKRIKVQLTKAMDDEDSNDFIKILKTVSAKSISLIKN
jgi:hypothetical protein